MLGTPGSMVRRVGKGRTSAAVGVGVGLKSLNAAGVAPSMALNRCIVPRRQGGGRGWAHCCRGWLALGCLHLVLDLSPCDSPPVSPGCAVSLTYCSCTPISYFIQ